MNKVILVGNLGQDPEIGATKDGKGYARLSLATSESWKDKATGERKERVQWHKIVCWGDGISKYLGEYAKKGSRLVVEGKLETRKYEKDGQDRYVTEIIVQGAGGSVKIVTKMESHVAGTGGPPPPDEVPEGRHAEQEIPF
jgi:single-strand DNA-binding protein